jgi:hypothetical protein
MNRTQDDFEGQPMRIAGELYWVFGLSMLNAALVIVGTVATYHWVASLF